MQSLIMTTIGMTGGTVDEALGPLQSHQQDVVRQKTDEFRATVQDYCKAFKTEAHWLLFTLVLGLALCAVLALCQLAVWTNPT